MHTLKMVVGGLAALSVFILAATLLGRRAADGARIFILPWLAASVINMGIGVYWAGVPLSSEIPVLAVVCSACRRRSPGISPDGCAPAVRPRGLPMSSRNARQRVSGTQSHNATSVVVVRDPGSRANALGREDNHMFALRTGG